MRFCFLALAVLVLGCATHKGDDKKTEKTWTVYSEGRIFSGLTPCTIFHKYTTKSGKAIYFYGAYAAEEE